MSNTTTSAANPETLFAYGSSAMSIGSEEDRLARAMNIPIEEFQRECTEYNVVIGDFYALVDQIHQTAGYIDVIGKWIIDIGFDFLHADTPTAPTNPFFPEPWLQDWFTENKDRFIENMSWDFDGGLRDGEWLGMTFDIFSFDTQGGFVRSPETGNWNWEHTFDFTLFGWNSGPYGWGGLSNLDLQLVDMNSQTSIGEDGVDLEGQGTVFSWATGIGEFEDRTQILSSAADTSLGHDGAAFSAGANLGSRDFSLGEIDAQNNNDQHIRLGGSLGVSRGVPAWINSEDSDGDGYREYGFGAEIPTRIIDIGFDLQTEDPLLLAFSPVGGVINSQFDIYEGNLTYDLTNYLANNETVDVLLDTGEAVVEETVGEVSETVGRGRDFVENAWEDAPPLGPITLPWP